MFKQGVNGGCLSLNMRALKVAYFFYIPGLVAYKLVAYIKKTCMGKGSFCHAMQFKAIFEGGGGGRDFDKLQPEVKNIWASATFSVFL